MSFIDRRIIIIIILQNYIRNIETKKKRFLREKKITAKIEMMSPTRNSFKLNETFKAEWKKNTVEFAEELSWNKQCQKLEHQSEMRTNGAFFFLFLFCRCTTFVTPYLQMIKLIRIEKRFFEIIIIITKTTTAKTILANKTKTGKWYE